MLDIKHIRHINDHSISEHITFTQSKLGIESIWSWLKPIKFDDSQKEQAGKPAGDKNTMVYMEDIPVNVDNNYHSFRHSVDYA